MSLEARCVWENGFSPRTQFVADGEYRLTIDRISLEATRYFKIALIFAYDSEYVLWRDMYPQQDFMPSFAQGLSGAVEWREFVFVLVRPLREHLSRGEKETALLSQYADLLSHLNIVMTPALMPRVRWVNVSIG